MNGTQKSLGDRMKEYEEVTNSKLYRRTSIICRIDGRSFHTVTKGMKKPFDLNFMEIMNNVAQEVFMSIPDSVVAYVESDEISIVICPYKTFATEPMFGGRIQKIVSVAASIATQAFIKCCLSMSNHPNAEVHAFGEKLLKKNITFDARVFNLQKEEILNYLIWRQQDSKRNAIMSAAQTWIGKKQSIGFKTTELIDKLKDEKGIDYWTAIPKEYHYGRTFYKSDNVDLLFCTAVNFKEDFTFKENLQKWIDYEEE